MSQISNFVLIVFLATLPACSNSDSSQDDGGRADQLAESWPINDRQVVCDAHLSSRDEEALAAVIVYLSGRPSCTGIEWKEILLVDTISPSTWTTDPQHFVPSNMPLNPPSAAVDEFICRNNHTVKIVSSRWSPIPIQLIEGSLVGGIDQLMKQYPNAAALLHLSLPGYDSSNSTAVIYYSQGCGSLSVTGYYAILQQGTSGWTVMQTISVWFA